ncbi:MFS transporter [Pseudodonghicola flavimaris]|uniref:MFS transporter n=1 Tax=Pseudodonghicola flavimaris TaxID=3050036 RepID=A0ABT7F1E6_9RHOB|nr:MFS transporter [Pseudodonghicola flavimaris]MDK3018426.1 MFS transporter [Pseudodonghicola flavimaris]
MTTLDPLAPPAAGTARPALVLALASVGAILATLDLFVVSVALPSIGRDFPDASLSDLSWILNSYAIVYAALLVFMGRLAERFRRNRSYLAGVALFTLGSAGCALSGTLQVILCFRVIEAIGAALMTPTSLGLVLAAFAPEKRSAAARLWAAIGGFAGALGPVIGGFLLIFGWQWVFLVNVPIGLAAILIGLRILPDIPGQKVPWPDLTGTLLATAGVALWIYGLITAGGQSWSAPGAWIGQIAGLALLAIFALHCLRARRPLIEPALFRNRIFTSATLALAPFMIAFGAFLLARVTWEQAAWGWSPFRTGLILAPGPFLVPLTSMLVANRLIARIGAPAVIVMGLVAFAASQMLTALGYGLTPSVPLSLSAAVLSGIGVGLALPTLMGTGAGALPASYFSTGSAVLNMIRQTGMAMGIALVVAVAGQAAATAPALAAFRLAWWVTAGCALVAIVPTLMIRPPAPDPGSRG